MDSPGIDDEYSAEDLSVALASLVGESALPVGGVIEVSRSEDVDRAAAALINRFIDDDDGAAFELLAHVAVPLLTELAHAVTRRVGLAISGETLVAEFMTSVFLDAGPGQRDLLAGGSFLSASTRIIEMVARRHLGKFTERRRTTGRPDTDLAALVDIEALFGLSAVALASGVAQGARGQHACSSSLDTECDSTRSMLAAAFHSLSSQYRRVLLLADVDELEDEAAALELGIDGGSIRELLTAARHELAREVQAQFARLSMSADDATLADLVYECLKASLLSIQHVRRRLHCLRPPRALNVVKMELRGRASRERCLDVLRVLDNRACSARGNGRGLALAKLAAALLELLEGATGRQRLAHALVQLLDDKPESAQQLLEPMFSEDHPASIRSHLCSNYLWALSRQGKHREALDKSRPFLEEFPTNKLLLFNVSVAASHVRDLSMFKQVAGRFRELGFVSADDEEHWRSLILFEARRFATELPLTATAVASEFGITV